MIAATQSQGPGSFWGWVLFAAIWLCPLTLLLLWQLGRLIFTLVRFAGVVLVELIEAIDEAHERSPAQRRRGALQHAVEVSNRISRSADETIAAMRRHAESSSH